MNITIIFMNISLMFMNITIIFMNIADGYEPHVMNARLVSTSIRDEHEHFKG